MKTDHFITKKQNKNDFFFKLILMKLNVIWNLPVAKIVLISKCDPFWITNPLIEQPANPYRLLQHFVAMLAAFDLFALRQHFPMPLNSADFGVHWNPPKRVNSLNMPWLIKTGKAEKY